MIRFRPLIPDDFPMLLEWLGRSHVKQWWDDGDDTLDKVAAHYTAHPDSTKRFIAVVDGKDAGYFQYYRANPTEIGVDQFLADAGSLSKGIGTECLRAFIELIVATEAPKTISLDPHPDNKQAIRCYEKCGFAHAPSRSTDATYVMTRNAN